MIILSKTSMPFHPQLYMNHIPITEVETNKHLGILFSSDGYWKNHIVTILSKANNRLALLRKLKYKLGRRSLEKRYITFIRPFVLYIYYPTSIKP